MRVGGIVLSALTLLGSLLGGLFILVYLTSTSSDKSLSYVVGLLITAPALVTGVLASILFFSGRQQGRLMARWFWLPTCLPVCVILGLHLMLLVPGPFLDSTSISCSKETPCRGARKCAIGPAWPGQVQLTPSCRRLCVADTECRAGTSCVEQRELVGSVVKVCAYPTRSSATPKPAAGVKERLEKADIRKGMDGVKERVQACHYRYKERGLTRVSLTIAPSGQVSSASVTGTHAGTPTGACIVGAVKGAKFSPFSGGPMTVNYPFSLP